jgi:hypothetical protein
VSIQSSSNFAKSIDDGPPKHAYLFSSGSQQAALKTGPKAREDQLGQKAWLAKKAKEGLRVQSNLSDDTRLLGAQL